MPRTFTLNRQIRGDSFADSNLENSMVDKLFDFDMLGFCDLQFFHFSDFAFFDFRVLISTERDRSASEMTDTPVEKYFVCALDLTPSHVVPPYA